MPDDLCRFSYFSTPVGVDFEQDIADIVAVASQRNIELGLELLRLKMVAITKSSRAG